MNLTPNSAPRLALGIFALVATSLTGCANTSQMATPIYGIIPNDIAINMTGLTMPPPPSTAAPATGSTASVDKDKGQKILLAFKYPLGKFSPTLIFSQIPSYPVASEWSSALQVVSAPMNGVANLATAVGYDFQVFRNKDGSQFNLSQTTTTGVEANSGSLAINKNDNKNSLSQGQQQGQLQGQQQGQQTLTPPSTTTITNVHGIGNTVGDHNVGGVGNINGSGNNGGNGNDTNTGIINNKSGGHSALEKRYQPGRAPRAYNFG